MEHANQANHDKTFLQGVALVLSVLVREHNMPTFAKSIAKEMGLSFKDFLDAEVEAQDLDALKKAFYS